MVASKSHGSARPRVAVVGHYTLLVDTIARSLMSTCRVWPVPLETFACVAAARDAVGGPKSDLVLLVVSAQDALDPVVLVEQLSARGARILVTGQIPGPETRAELIEAGAVRISDNEGITDLIRLVDAETAHDSIPHRAVLESPRPTGGPSGRSEVLATRRRLAQLTATENRILWRLMRGQTVDDIASAHVVSVATVRSQVQVVLRKLEVRTQLAAVALAWQHQWRPASGALAAA